MAGTFPAVRYLPAHQIDGRPCVVVDGGLRPEARITLSHWPGSGTPEPLLDDLSAQIVFRYLDQPAFHVDAEFVTNDHFDEDGLACIYTLSHPTEALARRARICDFAQAGDFGTFRDRESARCAFVVSAFADPERSPLGSAFFRVSDEQRVSSLFTELLGHLPEMLDHPDRFRELWQEEDAVLEATERALVRGDILIEHVPSLDLTVVTLPEDAVRTRVHRFAQVRQLAYHPMAIYNAAPGLRVLYVKGQHYELEYRYESWVRYMSRRPHPRVDLSPLSELLTLEERSLPGSGTPGVWQFEGVSSLTPRLHMQQADNSRLTPEAFRQRLQEFLATAPAAWNPYVAPGVAP